MSADVTRPPAGTEPGVWTATGRPPTIPVRRGCRLPTRPAPSRHIQARPGTTTGAERGAAPAAAARDRHLAAAGGEHRHLYGDGHRRRGIRTFPSRLLIAWGALFAPEVPTANGGACSLRRSSISTRCTSRSTCEARHARPGSCRTGTDSGDLLITVRRERTDSVPPRLATIRVIAPARRRDRSATR